MSKHNRIISMSLQVQAQLAEMFTEEDCENYINIENEDGDITDLVTAVVLGSHSFVSKLIGDKMNFLQANHTANSLIVQYLMKYGKTEDGGELEE